METNLRAAAHPADHFVSGDAVPVSELLKLPAVKVIGQNPRRLVSHLRVAKVTQNADEPLLAVCHMYHLSLTGSGYKPTARPAAQPATAAPGRPDPARRPNRPWQPSWANPALKASDPMRRLPCPNMNNVPLKQV